MICPNCHKPLPDGCKFCPECGASAGGSLRPKPMTIALAVTLTITAVTLVSVCSLLIGSRLGAHARPEALASSEAVEQASLMSLDSGSAESQLSAQISADPEAPAAVPLRLEDDAFVSSSIPATVLPGTYLQDGTQNRIIIHEVKGDQITFTVWWNRIWDISKCTATLQGNTLVFDYTSALNASLKAKGTLIFREHDIQLNLTECTHNYVSTGKSQFHLIGKRFSQEELQQISRSLGVPDTLKTQITQGEPVLWGGGGTYRTMIEIYADGELVAASNVDSITGALAGTTTIYPGISIDSGASDSGQCGPELTWSLDANGMLTISGKGFMYNYPGGDETPPWLNSAVKVTAVNFVGSITSIGENAFIGTQIRNISIPATVTNIEYGALTYIDTLEGIWVDPANPVYANDNFGVLFTKDKSTLIAAPKTLYGLYVVPDSVTWIYDNAFFKCTKLMDIRLPAGLTRIGQGAFSTCTALESIHIPEGVTEIDHYTFYGCTKLATIYIPSAVTRIASTAFLDSGLQSIYYGGTQAQWQQAAKEIPNLTAKVHVGSARPTAIS